MTSREAKDLLLVGGAGPAPLGIDIAMMFMDQAEWHGVRTHIVGLEDDLAKTPTVCERAESVAVLDIEDPAACAGWAGTTLAAGGHFDAAYSLREIALMSTAAIVDVFGLPGNSAHSIDNAQNKASTRRLLTAAGLRQPASIPCESKEEVHQAARGIRAPWIVKPRRGSGSEGVSLVHDPSGLDDAVELARAHGSMLLEQFVVGTEYSVEGIFTRQTPVVLAITDKDRGPLPYFVEYGHTIPAPVTVDDDQAIRESVAAAVTAVGLSYGLFDVEVWLTPGGVVVGEVNPRLGGDYLHQILHHSIHGLEMFGETIEDLLGVGREPTTRALTGGGATRYLIPPPGTVTKIVGWAEVASHPAVLASEINIVIGDTVAPCLSSDDRVVAVTVGAESGTAAAQLADDLLRRVSILVE